MPWYIRCCNYISTFAATYPSLGRISPEINIHFNHVPGRVPVVGVTVTHGKPSITTPPIGQRAGPQTFSSPEPCRTRFNQSSVTVASFKLAPGLHQRAERFCSGDLSLLSILLFILAVASKYVFPKSLPFLAVAADGDWSRRWAIPTHCKCNYSTNSFYKTVE